MLFFRVWWPNCYVVYGIKISSLRSAAKEEEKRGGTTLANAEVVNFNTTDQLLGSSVV